MTIPSEQPSLPTRDPRRRRWLRWLAFMGALLSLVGLSWAWGYFELFASSQPEQERQELAQRTAAIRPPQPVTLTRLAEIEALPGVEAVGGRVVGGRVLLTEPLKASPVMREYDRIRLERASEPRPVLISAESAKTLNEPLPFTLNLSLTKMEDPVKFEVTVVGITNDRAMLALRPTVEEAMAIDAGLPLDQVTVTSFSVLAREGEVATAAKSLMDVGLNVRGFGGTEEAQAPSTSSLSVWMGSVVCGFLGFVGAGGFAVLVSWGLRRRHPSCSRRTHVRRCLGWGLAAALGATVVTGIVLTLTADAVQATKVAEGIFPGDTTWSSWLLVLPLAQAFLWFPIAALCTLGVGREKSMRPDDEVLTFA